MTYPSRPSIGSWSWISKHFLRILSRHWKVSFKPIYKRRTHDDDSAGAEVGEVSSSVLEASGESEPVASEASPPSVGEGAPVSESSAGVEADGSAADDEESPPSAGGAEAPPPP